MELTIRPKNFKLAANLETQIRKRIERLPRHLENLQTAEVVLTQQPTRLNPQRFDYVAQLTLHTRNNLIRSEVSDPELLTAVDQAMDNISRRIERHKGRMSRRHKGIGLGKSSAEVVTLNPPGAEAAGDGALGAPSAVAQEEEAGEFGSVVRVKHFPVKPMFAEEAIEQMELLGHNFFVFYNAEDELMSVLYKRDDGNYGLLAPELT
jgi:putative sigma-54 modulation protein